jgi:hypothetical protein
MLSTGLHFASESTTASPETTKRRPKDNIYEFELSASKYNSYSEEEVCNHLVQLEKGMPASEAANLGIDTIDPSVKVDTGKTS